MLGLGKGSSKPVMGVYTIYDRVAEEAGPLFLAVNDAVALRSYRQLVQSAGVVAEEEYTLYKIGSYDSKTMKVDGVPLIKVVVPPIMDDMRQPRLPGIQEVVNG